MAEMGHFKNNSTGKKTSATQAVLFFLGQCAVACHDEKVVLVKRKKGGTSLLLCNKARQEFDKDVSLL